MFDSQTLTSPVLQFDKRALTTLHLLFVMLNTAGLSTITLSLGKQAVISHGNTMKTLVLMQKCG